MLPSTPEDGILAVTMAQPEKVVTLGPQGRLVVPAAFRRELGLEEGSSLAVRTEGRRLILEPRREVLRRIRSRYAKGPKHLSDELVSDRRAEARRESRK
jgi:AbrB family looped-hinge helix DNA binding protein